MDEFSKLSDRELDDAVAVRVIGIKVLGWAHCWAPDGCWSVERESVGHADGHPVYQDCEDLWVDDEDARRLHGTIAGVSVFACKPVPWYSTDMNAALMVLDKLRDDWTSQLFRFAQWDLPNDSWECQLRNNKDTQILAEHATLPRAICLAALAATEEIDA